MVSLVPCQGLVWHSSNQQGVMGLPRAATVTEDTHLVMIVIAHLVIHRQWRTVPIAAAMADMGEIDIIAFGLEV